VDPTQPRTHYSSLSYIVSRVIGFLRTHRYEILFLISLALSYVLVIVYWTHGKLLFGGDGVGYYNYYNFLQSPSFSGLIWAFTEFMSLNNIYAMYYSHLFLSALFSVAGIYILTRIILKNISGKRGIMLGMLASLLFLFNPWSVSLTYLSLVGDVSIGAGGLTFFFIGLFLFLNDVTYSKGTRKFTPIIAGIGLGIAQSPFPNYIRLLFVVVVIFLAAELFLIMHKRTRNLHYLGGMLVFALVCILVSIGLSQEYFIPIVSNIHSTVALANAGAADKVYLGFYTGQFNDLLNELRGLSQWQYPGIFYYSLYVNLGVIFVISFLWPIFALAIPLLLVKHTDKKDAPRIFILVLALLLVIFWDKGENAPFGQLWIIINSFLPTGYQFIPTGYLTSIFITRFFPILSAFSIISVYDILQSHHLTAGKRGLFLKRLKKVVAGSHILPFMILIILTILLIASAYPAFAGYAETYSYNGSNQNNQGFFIPQSYYQAKTFLANNNNGSVLLLPPTTSNPYITTNWGYSGEIGFYSSFFAPINIITLNNFGGTYSNATQLLEYEELTQPKLNASNALDGYVYNLEDYKIRYLLIDASITSGIAETAKRSYSLVMNLVNVSFAKIVFADGDLTIASINYNEMKSNAYVSYPEVTDTNSSQPEIYSYNQNASRFQTFGVADAGNTVTFSIPGYNGTIPPVWYENGSLLGRSYFENITFPSPGLYNISARFPNGTLLHMNYTVNKRISPIILVMPPPQLVETGTTVYLTGVVSGGTTFPEASYNWEWYINGVYQKSIGDSSYGIQVIFNRSGTYNITLVVHDGLLENASTSTVLHAEIGIYSYNQNASRFQTFGVADAGNTVTFSIPGYNGTIPPVWYENGSLLGRSYFENITFPSPGLYNISARFPNGTLLHMNYTVNKRISPIILVMPPPQLVETGTTVYLTGVVSGGTTFPEASYNWEWYINGVYQKSIGDSSYGIQVIFNRSGTYNITLVVHDGLLENASTSTVLHVLSPLIYKIDMGFRENVTPGSTFYFFVVIIAVFETITNVRANRGRK
jgi:hypothetical protein